MLKIQVHQRFRCKTVLTTFIFFCCCWKLLTSYLRFGSHCTLSKHANKYYKTRFHLREIIIALEHSILLIKLELLPSPVCLTCYKISSIMLILSFMRSFSHSYYSASVFTATNSLASATNIVMSSGYSNLFSHNL